MSLGYPLYQNQPPPSSPTATFVNIQSLSNQNYFNVYGSFDLSSAYKARFRTNLISDGNLYFEESACTLLSVTADILTCWFPSQWRGGFRASVLSILEQPKSVASWRIMWSRACFMSSCGYVSASQRTENSNIWYVNPANSSGFVYNSISKGVSGSVTYVWFVIQSDVYELIPSQNLPIKVFSLGALEGTGIFANLKYPFTQTSPWTYPVQGASKIKIFNIETIDYLFVANFWNGLVFNITSSIFRIDPDSSGNLHATYIQGIPTQGASDWCVFFLAGTKSFYVAVANFLGSSFFYRWEGPQYIKSVETFDPGAGYIAGEIILAGNGSRSFNDRFRAQFSVDGNDGGLNVWLKSNQTRGCSLTAITGLWVEPNTTAKCSVGTLVLGTNSVDGLLGNVSKVDHDGSILSITVVSGIRVFNQSATIGFELSSKQSSCTCWSGDWKDCIKIQYSSIQLTFRAIDTLNQGVGFSAAVDAVDGSGRILDISVTSEGFDYTDNIEFELLEMQIVPLSPPKSCECFANDSISWSGCLEYSRSTGKIADVNILDHGSRYFADEEFDIVYQGTQIPMTGTVTNLWTRSVRSSGCSLALYTNMKPKTNMTVNCSVGALFIGSKDADGLEGSVTAVDSFGRITEIKVLQPAKQIGGDPEISIKSPSSCSCLSASGSWSDCFDLETSPINISVEIYGDKTGFLAYVTEVDGNGSITKLRIEGHGSGFSLNKSNYQRYLVIESSVSSSENIFLSAGQQCHCTGSSWSDCFGISIAEGSTKCRGGYNEGSPCMSDASCISACGDTCSPNEHGQCVRSPSAAITALPIQDPLVPVLDPLYAAEGDWWTVSPVLSSAVPVDTNTKQEIHGCEGASAIANFSDSKGVGYLACAVYYNPSLNSVSTFSIIYQLQVLDDRNNIALAVWQYIATNAANDVYTWIMNYGLDGPFLFIAFACENGFSSPVLRWNDGLRKFEQIQELSTSSASSLRVFSFENTSYLLIGQTGENSLVLRWNGTLFLGLNSINTLPKDTAGGQNIRSDNAQAVLFYEIGTDAKYLLVGNYQNMSYIYRSRIENVSGLENPISVVFTSNARYIYVASYGSRSIAAFNFESKELVYNSNNSIQESDLLPLAGLCSLAIFTSTFIDEQQGNRSFLYSASAMDDGGMINVFYIDGTSGFLVEQPQMRTAGCNFGLRGVRALLATQSFLFSAAIFDQSVSVFQINSSTGSLGYVDHVTNGERLVARYSNQLASWLHSNYDNSFSFAWKKNYLNKSVISVKSFDMLKRSMIAVVSGSRTAEEVSEALLFEYTNSSLVLLQTIESGTYPTDMEYVSVNSSSAGYMDLMLIASQTGTVKAYVWSLLGQKFILQSILINTDRFYPSKLTLLSAKVDDMKLVIIGVHCLSECPNDLVSSIYKWDWILNKFSLFQNLNSAAFDISFATWPNTLFQSTFLLALANYGNPEVQVSGSCKIFEYGSGIRNNITGQLGSFLPLTGNATIPGQGVASVIFFEIIGSGQFLAMACRQKNSSVPYGYVSTGTNIFQWHSDKKLFFFFQTLDTVKSVALSSIGWKNNMMDSLVGPTDLKVFVVGEDTYLGIAQSICGWSLAVGQCQAVASEEPQSAILQWISAPWPGRFDEIPALSESMYGSDQKCEGGGFNPVRHIYPFRVPFGAVGRIEYGVLEQIPFVLLGSFTGGLVIFEWKFEQIFGLQRVISLNSLSNLSVVAASAAEGAMTVFELSFEEVYFATSTQLYLQYKVGLLDHSENKNFGSYFAVKGVYSVDVLESCAQYLSVGDPSQICIVAHTRSPRNERLCGPYDPIWPPWINPLDSQLGPLPCQSLTFFVSQISGGDSVSGLFQEKPKISKEGTLFFSLKEAQFGDVLLRIILVDDGKDKDWSLYSAPFTYDVQHGFALNAGKNTSEYSLVSIKVIPINDSLPFSPVPVLVAPGEEATAIFAENISVVENQTVTFIWDWIWLKAENMQCLDAVIIPEISDFDQCQAFCNSNSSCIYFSYNHMISISPCSVSFNGCSLVSAKADTYQNPRYYFETGPILNQSLVTNVGVMSLTPRPFAFKSFEINVSVIDSRKKAWLVNKRESLLSNIVVINIISRNNPPEYLVSNISTFEDSESVHIPHWLTNVSAGAGECSCSELLCVYGGWPKSLPCQNLSFYLLQVEKVTSDGLKPVHIFASFDPDVTSGWLNFTIAPNVSGTFKLNVAMIDDGNSVLGNFQERGENTTYKSVYLIVNLKQRVFGSATLSIPQTSSSFHQIFQYFQIKQSLVYDFSGQSRSVLDQIVFSVVNESCTNTFRISIGCNSIFQSQPEVLNNGSLAFSLVPEAYGSALISVRVNITGTSYSSWNVDIITIEIVAVNKPPTCVFPQNITVVNNLRPQVISPFATKISAGPPDEQWQKVFFTTVVTESPIQQFVFSPILDSKGAIYFQLVANFIGVARILVSCFDNGGTLFGGVDYSGPYEVNIVNTLSFLIFHPSMS